MPIVNHTIQTDIQADGSSSNVLRMFDQDATEYMQVFRAPAGFNIAAKVSLAIAEMDEHLAQREFQALVGL